MTIRPLFLGLLLAAGLPACTNAEQSSTQTRAHKNNIIYFSDIATKGSPEETFNSLIAKGNVVIDFYADWCGPCKSLGSTLASIAPEFPHVTFVKINVDTYKSLASGIRSIPVLAFYKDGKKISQSVGGKKQSELRTLLITAFGK